MSAPFHNTSLYVGNLKPEVTENDLFLHFSAVGPLHSTRVCRDAITRMSLKYGYVNFQSQADAERAVDSLNYSHIQGQPCRLMWSQRDPSLRRSGAGNIFIKNLEKSIDEKILYDTFSMFGTILSCKIETDETGKSRGFGYVHYETLEAAEAAINQVNGKMINELIVYVGKFIPKKQPSEVRFNNIYVKNLDESIDSNKLSETFSQFGEIISPFVVTDNQGRSRGFGFVSFHRHEDAVKAIEGMNGVEVCGKSIYCTRALKKEERFREIQAQTKAFRMSQQKKYEGTNLYVKYLDDDVDDIKLTDAFKTYGPIIRAAVMRNPDGRSKGFGFVCFHNAEDAERALREVHNKLVWSRPLYVTQAQRKDERRAYLEAIQSTRGQRLDAPFFGPAGGMYPANLYYGGMPPRPVYGYPPVRYSSGMGSVPMGGPGVPGRGPANPVAQAPGALNPAAGRPGQGSPYYANPAVAAGGHHQSFHTQGRARPLRNPNIGGAPGGPSGYPPLRANAPGNPGPLGGQGVQGQAVVAQRVRNGPPGPVPMNAAGPNAGRFRFGTNAPANVRPTGAPNRGPVPAGQPGLQQLSQIPSEDQRRILGDAIFHRVSASYPQLATRITGMILEMDTSEVVSLLEFPEALTNKVEEAKKVLEEYSLNAGPAEQFTAPQHGVPIANSS